MEAKSPVKCRLMSVIGLSWLLPPPAAPPFMPNTGPIDGSRSAAAAVSPMWARPSTRPTVVVVLPSPAGVGLVAVTRMSLLPSRRCMPCTYGSETFALCGPYRKISFAGMPIFAAISSIGSIGVAAAISTSVGMSSSGLVKRRSDARARASVSTVERY